MMKNININWGMVREQKEEAKKLCLEGKLDEARAVVEKFKAMQAILDVADRDDEDARQAIWDCENLFGNLDWWEGLEDEEKLRELLHEVGECF